MADPFLLVVVVFLAVAGAGGLVVYLLSPAREKFLSDDPLADPAINDSRISSQWAGDTLPISHHHAGTPFHGGFDGSGHAG